MMPGKTGITKDIRPTTVPEDPYEKKGAGQSPGPRKRRDMKPQKHTNPILYWMLENRRKKAGVSETARPA